MTFQPRRATVTASDAGIGRATAVALADTGMDVGVTWYSDQAGAQDTAAEIRRAGAEAETARLDTADIAGCGAVIDELADSIGGVDVFVNNARTGSATPALEMTVEQWRYVIAADLDGAFGCLQRAARRMVASGTGGRLIAITSVREHQPRVGSAAYDAAEHGLGGLMKTLALELGRYAITANCVAPGEIATPMTRSGRPGSARPTPAGCAAWPAGRCQGDSAGDRVPGLSPGVLCHRRGLARQWRNAANGPTDRIAYHHR